MIFELIAPGIIRFADNCEAEEAHAIIANAFECTLECHDGYMNAIYFNKENENVG